MAWPGDITQTIITSNGLGAKWMHAICLAVNERQGALGISKSSFFRADSTTGTDLPLEDIQGILTTSGSPRFNLDIARDAVISMLNNGYFTETSGISDVWTVANIETEMGLGAFTANMDRIQELLYWQRLKEALDLMIYARKPTAPTGGSRDSYTANSSTPQLAWDNLLAASPGVFPVAGAGVSVVQTGTSTPTYPLAMFRTCTGISIDLSSLAGTITGLEFQMSHNYTNSPVGTLDYTIGTTASSTISAAATVYLTGSTSEVTIGSTDTIDMDFDTLPTTTPFDSVLGASLISASLTYAIPYYDITSELTDQA